MAYNIISFNPDEFTDASISPGTGDNSFSIGGLTFTVLAQGTWNLNFSGNRLNFSEDPTYAAEQFIIRVQPTNGGTFRYDDLTLQYFGAPLSNAYLLFANLSTGDSSISGTGGPLNYKDAGFQPIDFSSYIEIRDQGFRPEDPNPTSSFWLDDFSVEIVAPPNQAPTATNLTQTIAYFEDPATAVPLIDIVVSDANSGDTITATLTLSVAAAGVLTTGTFGSATSTFNPGTGVWTVSGSVADVNGALAAVAFSPTGDWDQNVTISIRIRDAADTGPADGTISLDVTPVNDAPTMTATGTNPTFTENGAAVALFSGATVSTIEAGQSITALAVTVSGIVGTGQDFLTLEGSSIALINGTTGTIGSAAYSVSANAGAAIVTLTNSQGFAPAAAQLVVEGLGYRNSSDDPSTNGRVVTLTSITDDGGTANGGVDTTSLSITSTVSVVAVNDAPVLTTSGGLASALEQIPLPIDGWLTVSDIDDTTLASATIRISGNFLSSEDRLAFANNGVTMGNIVGTYNAVSGELSLSSAGATATVAQWQAALRTVAYENTSDTPNTATRTIDFTVNDGTSSSNLATKSVAVSAVNDAPSIVAPTDLNATANLPLALSGISFSDVDAGTQPVTVTLSVPSGALSATSGGGTVVAGTTTNLTLTGSIADINAFVAGSNVTFTPSSNSAANVTLGVEINDGGNSGTGGAKVDIKSIAIAVAGVGPTLTDANIAISGASGAGGVFLAGDTVTAVWNNSPTGDNNAGVNGVTVDFSQFGGGSAIAATVSDGIWTASYVLAAGGLDATNRNISVSATDSNGTNTVTDTTNAAVDTVVPQIASVAVPAAGTYYKDDALSFTVTLDGAVSIDTSGGAPRLAIALNTGGLVYADFVGANGTDLTFNLVVSPGQVDKDGIEITALQLNGAKITDASGNTLNLTLRNIGDTGGVLIDAPLPGGGGPTTPVEPTPVPRPVDPDGGPIIAGPEAEIFIGGDATDMVTFPGSRSDYVITRNADGSYTIKGPHAPDTLNSIERLKFDDGVLALDVDGGPGQAFRLYLAAFDRDPDFAGIGYWVAQLDTGAVSFSAIAESFLNSPEFERIYGRNEELSDQQFVELLYLNTLKRDFDQDGFDYWLSKLNDGETNRADLLAFFADSQEGQDRVAAIIADGIWMT